MVVGGSRMRPGDGSWVPPREGATLGARAGPRCPVRIHHVDDAWGERRCWAEEDFTISKKTGILRVTHQRQNPARIIRFTSGMYSTNKF